MEKYSDAFSVKKIDKPLLEVEVPLGINKQMLSDAVEKTKEFC